MSYRDHIEAQKKYIETKKSRHSWVKMAEDRPGAHMATLPPRIRSGVGGRLPRRPLLSYCRLFCFILAQGSPARAESDTLTLAVVSTEAEFNNIKNWLEPEILAHGLTWKIEHHYTRQSLEDHLANGPIPDLLVIEEGLAQEYFRNHVLAPLRETTQYVRFRDCFYPLWTPPRPFQKSMGLAAAGRGNVEQARHLCIIIKQFITPPFEP